MVGNVQAVGTDVSGGAVAAGTDMVNDVKQS